MVNFKNTDTAKHSESQLTVRTIPCNNITISDMNPDFKQTLWRTALAENMSSITPDRNIAEVIMDELVNAGAAEFLLIRDDDIRIWWEGVLAQRAMLQQLREEVEHRERLYQTAVSKLSTEELNAIIEFSKKPKEKEPWSWDPVMKF